MNPVYLTLGCTVLCALTLASAVSPAQAAIYPINFVGGEPGQEGCGGLAGTNAVPSNASTAGGGEAGHGILYNDDTNELEVNVFYGMFGCTRLEGNYTQSAIRVGAIGVSGSLIVDLKPIQVSLNPRYGFFQGKVVIPQEYEAALLSGQVYMEIASNKFPLGEIRGQLALRDLPDIGLRIFDGAATNRIACEVPGPGGTLVSSLRIAKDGTNYGIVLVETNAPVASKIHVKTASGIKALRKLP